MAKQVQNKHSYCMVDASAKQKATVKIQCAVIRHMREIYFSHAIHVWQLLASLYFLSL